MINCVGFLWGLSHHRNEVGLCSKFMSVQNDFTLFEQQACILLAARFDNKDNSLTNNVK